VITAGNESLDTGGPESIHLARKVQAGVTVSPIAATKVASDHCKRDLLCDGMPDQVGNCSARCGPDAISGCSIVSCQPAIGLLWWISGA
jgi:hypothetical protein